MPRDSGRKLGCVGGMLYPQNFKYCLKVSSKNNCGTTTDINRNFLLKYNKFAKILAEFNAQITGNGLYSALDFKTLPGENSTGRPIKHDYVYSERPHHHSRTQLRSRGPRIEDTP